MSSDALEDRTRGEDERARGTLGDLLDEWNPIYFGMVMATGIVSIAAHLLELRAVGRGLFAVNVVAYLLVSALTLARVARDPRSAVRDVTTYEKGVGSFTAIAGTCVLGSQFVVFGVSTVVGMGLFLVGATLWVVLVYAVFTGLTVRATDEPIDESLDGSWLLMVVATQSVAVLAGLLAPAYGALAPELLLVALTMYSMGGLFYLMLIPLLFYRLVFFPVDPRSMTSPYWINAGAVAITTLAGATLVAAADHWAFLATIRQFLVGFTFFYWAAATWWIPLLFALGVWRHAVGGVALPHTTAGYDPEYWAMVFPLGMYTASTFRLANVAALDTVGVVAECFVYVALVAWAAAALGLTRRLVGRVSTLARE